VNTFINANSAFVSGLELISRNKITKFWDLTSNFNLFTSRIDIDNQPRPEQFPSFFVKLNNSFKLPKNFSYKFLVITNRKLFLVQGVVESVAVVDLVVAVVQCSLEITQLHKDSSDLTMVWTQLLDLSS
jgi:hypothetical protein